MGTAPTKAQPAVHVVEQAVAAGRESERDRRFRGYRLLPLPPVPHLAGPLKRTI
jgi:hypothetical protein